MKIIGISCSPRKGGNTDIMLDAALTSAREAGAKVETFTIVGKTISPCNGCEACQESGECNIDDDMKSLYVRMLEADGIIFAAPVYFWSVSAQAKTVIDRTYCLQRRRALRNKLGAMIVVTRRVGGTGAFTLLNNYFSLQRMRLVGGAIGFGDKKGDARQDKRGLAESRAVGKAMVAQYLDSRGKAAT